jgi:hypothetical protein
MTAHKIIAALLMLVIGILLAPSCTRRETVVVAEGDIVIPETIYSDSWGEQIRRFDDGPIRCYIYSRTSAGVSISCIRRGP